MAGHNKWSKIKHKKAKTDRQKGKLFSKMGRDIAVAVRLGGGDDEALNMRLRLAVQLAKAANMPNDTIQRAIQRGLGPDAADQQERLFEAYAPSGVALLIETLSDNNNRTVANIKAILNKHGGSLATKGAVAYQFNRVGHIIVATADTDAVLTVFLASSDLLIHDVTSVESTQHVWCPPEQLMAVHAALEAATLPVEYAALTYEPTHWVSVSDSAPVMTLIDRLDADDDVQQVYSNYRE